MGEGGADFSYLCVCRRGRVLSQLRLVLAVAAYSESKQELEVVLSEHPNSMMNPKQLE